MDDKIEQEETEEGEGVDVIELVKILLPILRENNVHSCQVGGLTVVFNEPNPDTLTPSTAVEAAKIKDDGHSTSNKRVSGFKDPALWQWQNGKVLDFDGTLK